MPLKISVSEISKSFHHKQVLFNLSLECFSGEMIALIGPLGSSEPTLSRHINWLAKANNGHVNIFD